jgi:hypothetical protein
MAMDSDEIREHIIFAAGKTMRAQLPALEAAPTSQRGITHL